MVQDKEEAGEGDGDSQAQSSEGPMPPLTEGIKAYLAEIKKDFEAVKDDVVE